MGNDNRGGVYVWVNTQNGHTYIGSSGCIRRRRDTHLYDLKHGSHRNEHLQRAWNRYGADAFEFRVLEYVADPMHLAEREQFYIDTLKPEYNQMPQAQTVRGWKHRPETRARIAKTNTGRRHSAETIEKMRATQIARLASPEARLKVSQGQRKRFEDPKQLSEHRSRWHATIHKASEMRRGQPMPQETREKIRAALKGRHLPKRPALISQLALTWESDDAGQG